MTRLMFSRSCFGSFEDVNKLSTPTKSNGDYRPARKRISLMYGETQDPGCRLNGH
jgi:hypothetical protein